jgi:hypothetical protein
LSSPDQESVVERSVEEYSLNEPIGAMHGEMAPSAALRDCATANPYHPQHSDTEGIPGNPFSEEPHPAMVGAVRRFGIAGLVAGALGAALLRWWKSLAG